MLQVGGVKDVKMYIIIEIFFFFLIFTKTPKGHIIVVLVLRCGISLTELTTFAINPHHINSGNLLNHTPTLPFHT